MIQGQPGRPAVGLDLGGTKILGAVIAPDGKVLSRVKQPTLAKDGPHAVIQRVCDCIRGAVEKAELDLEAIGAVGVAVPCPVDPVDGFVENASNLGWKNLPAKKLIETHLGRPVWLENDVNAGTYGELRYGAAREREHIVGLFPGTGIGGGVVIHGKLYRGFNQTAGEIGHIIMKPGGPVQGDGFPGSLEALASRLALVKWLGKQILKGRKSLLTKQLKLGKKQKKKGWQRRKERIRSNMIREAAERGDKLVLEGLERNGRILGTACANLIHILNPEMIVLGGGLMEACGAWILPSVNNTLVQYTYEIERRKVEVVAAQLGDDATIIGAAALARDAEER